MSRPGSARPLPISRDPYSYVSRLEYAIPTVKPMAPNLGQSGVRRAANQIIRPSSAPPAHKRFVPLFTTPLPCGTSNEPDKLFDDGITFPRGDIGAQQFGRPTAKRDGDAWLKTPRSQQTVEIGTSPRAHLRAFCSPRSNAIMYQAMPLSSARRKELRERPQRYVAWTK